MTAIEANHPYIINVSEPVSEFTVDEVDIEPVEKPMVNYGTKSKPKSIVGTYVAQTEVPELGLFLSENNFWYSTGATKMKAFRAYFKFIDVLTEVDSADSNVKMSIGGEETRIDGLLPETSNDAIYDLTGRKVEKAEKGIYIVNGKKVLK